jgi:hypothetical protein
MSESYKDYVNDPKTVYLKTNVDLSTASVVKGYYILPDATAAYITGTVNDRDGDSSNKWIKVTVPHSTLKLAGVTKWQSYIEFPEHTAGHGVHGSVAELVIYDLGD